MRETMILIMVGALGTVTKSLEKRLVELEIRKRIKNVQMAALLRRLKCPEESWTREEICCHSVSSERPRWREKLERSKIMIICIQYTIDYNSPDVNKAVEIKIQNHKSTLIMVDNLHLVVDYGCLESTFVACHLLASGREYSFRLAKY